MPTSMFKKDVTRRQIACPDCPPNDANLVEARVPKETLEQEEVDSIEDLDDEEIHRLAVAGRADIPYRCHVCGSNA